MCNAACQGLVSCHGATCVPLRRRTPPPRSPDEVFDMCPEDSTVQACLDDDACLGNLTAATNGTDVPPGNPAFEQIYRCVIDTMSADDPCNSHQFDCWMDDGCRSARSVECAGNCGDSTCEKTCTGNCPDDTCENTCDGNCADPTCECCGDESCDCHCGDATCHCTSSGNCGDETCDCVDSGNCGDDSCDCSAKDQACMNNTLCTAMDTCRESQRSHCASFENRLGDCAANGCTVEAMPACQLCHETCTRLPFCQRNINGPPSVQQLQAACPSEYEACVSNSTCGDELAYGLTDPPDFRPSHPGMMALVACIQADMFVQQCPGEYEVCTASQPCAEELEALLGAGSNSSNFTAADSDLVTLLMCLGATGANMCREEVSACFHDHECVPLLPSCMESDGHYLSWNNALCGNVVECVNGKGEGEGPPEWCASIPVRSAPDLTQTGNRCAAFARATSAAQTNLRPWTPRRAAAVRPHSVPFR